jgi:hypothetical protein
MDLKLGFNIVGIKILLISTKTPFILSINPFSFELSPKSSFFVDFSMIYL